MNAWAQWVFLGLRSLAGSSSQNAPGGGLERQLTVLEMPSLARNPSGSWALPVVWGGAECAGTSLFQRQSWTEPMQKMTTN